MRETRKDLLKKLVAVSLPELIMYNIAFSFYTKFRYICTCMYILINVHAIFQFWALLLLFVYLVFNHELLSIYCTLSPCLTFTTVVIVRCFRSTAKPFLRNGCLPTLKLLVTIINEVMALNGKLNCLRLRRPVCILRWIS